MQKVFNLSLVFLFMTLFSQKSWSYPEFISYGYNNCLACHYNGQGGGSLNEYGKGIFASELASRVFYPVSVTEDQLAENSGFPGTEKLPWWYRPGLKYRGLWFQTNPGSQSHISKYVTMQADFNNAIFFDQNQKYVVIASVGYNANSLGSSSDNVGQWISREHYLRWQAKDDMMVYVGLMDKVFGIRHVDHTSYSRRNIGIAQNDQTHGVAVTLTKAPWDYTVHAFTGNLTQESHLQHKGVSAMAEYDVKNMFRLGGSVLYSKNNYMNWTRAAVHSKYGFIKGSSLLSELGFIQNKPVTGDSTTGMYLFLSSMSLMAQGVNFLSQLEYYNETMTTNSPDKIRWSLGLLMFPAPRFELRTMLQDGRSIADTTVADDQWSMQIQLHISI